MPIDLGLSRVTRLLHHLGDPQNTFKSIHIAGTNGKGSTVAYLSSILSQASIRNGRFTSPHIIHYNDCICINNEEYPLSKFNKVNELVLKENDFRQLGCTEFELLTVTAFKIFELEKVQLAVIEVGLGGRLDATNVLKPYQQNSKGGGVIATAITKIGIDHESFLGNTISDIALEKAGILKRFIPCITDKTNLDAALSSIKERAEENKSDLHLVDGLGESGVARKMQSLLKYSPLKGEYQLQNLSVALKVIDVINKQNLVDFKDEQGNFKVTDSSIINGIKRTRWPGRLQSIEIPNKGLEILLDGAHNESAAIELGKYLLQFRENGEGIIFVIGVTKGKSVDNLLRHITRKNEDTIIVTSFTSPEKMPWVTSIDPNELFQLSKKYVNDATIANFDPDIEKVFDYVQSLKLKGDTRKVVICGSLYLCADVLRYVETI